jgi:hypothetical protein
VGPSRSIVRDRQGETTLTGQQLADSEEIGPPRGPSVEASISDVESGDIPNSDIEAWVEERVEEASFRQGMLNYARVVGWVGWIMVIMLVVLLIEGLQNRPLLISN